MKSHLGAFTRPSHISVARQAWLLNYRFAPLGLSTADILIFVLCFITVDYIRGLLSRTVTESRAAKSIGCLIARLSYKVTACDNFADFYSMRVSFY